MKQTIKSIIALALCLSMVLALTACGGGGGYGIPTTRFEPTTEYDFGLDFTYETHGYDETYGYEETTPSYDTNERVSVITGNEKGDLRYVMIYNPKIYSEDNVYAYPGSLSTGTLGLQIDTSMLRADGLETPDDFPYKPWEQLSFSDLPMDEINLDGNRADPMVIPYNVGDTKVFFCFDTYDQRAYAEFTCMYTGTYCNIWTFDPQFTADMAALYANAFDTYVYPNMVTYAGSARFAENGGKVNLLFYPLSQNTLGLFYLYDILASTEVSETYAMENGINTDHAILSISSTLAMNPANVDLMCSTMAHEFQHLICATDHVYTTNGAFANTWLNEAMSGYLEEMLYPGAKYQAGHYYSFAKSNSIRYGQSLYNFSTEYDIGVYGSVYFFAEYLADLVSRNSTYRNFHDSWRNSYSSSICDAEGLYNIVPSSEIERISNQVQYSDSVYFSSYQEEFMSKLTLDFYMSLFESASGNSSIAAYSNVDMYTLLYDQINSTTIEGGGRIIVAVNDNTFNIPSDADDGLVYVGFDANFNPITPFITN